MNCDTFDEKPKNTEQPPEPEEDPRRGGPESGRRPYMDYRPFSGAYAENAPEQTAENGCGQNRYEQTPYWKRPYEEQNDFDPGRTGFAIAALVLGIIALCCFCIPVFAVPLGILAVIFAALGMNSINRGLAVAGLVLGIIAMVLGALMIIIFLLSGSGTYHHSLF